MLIILSPAKTLDFSPMPPHLAGLAATTPELLDQSRILVARLREFSPDALAGLMGISDALAVLNAGRYSAWSTPFTPDNAKPAALAFAGDVYEGLDASALSPADFDFAQRHVRILSGLYGLLRPLDLIQAYRLEMGTRLENPRGKDLYAFWGDRLTEALNRALPGQAATLVNLASEEYFRAINPRRLSAPVIQPVFEDWKGGRYKVISFHAKRARGLMARFAITARLSSADGLKEFSAQGYCFDAAASDARRWVFRRRVPA